MDLDDYSRTAEERDWRSGIVRNALATLIGTLVDWTERADGGNHSFKRDEDIPRHVVRVWNRYGFARLGDHPAPKNPWMHFEFIGTPVEAVDLVQTALRDLAPRSTPGS